jgi:hypothetical protein
MERSQYEELERELTIQNIANLNINPFAFKLLFEAYRKKVYPETLELLVQLHGEDPIQDPKVPQSTNLVEITMKKPGYLGKKKHKNPKDVDSFGVKLVAQSYYYQVRPLPISFFFGGVEVHIRTPKFAEFARKNIARNIYNPTATKSGKIIY